jgi:hypothetical protein
VNNEQRQTMNDENHAKRRKQISNRARENQNVNIFFYHSVKNHHSGTAFAAYNFVATAAIASDTARNL